jgi:Mg-chelatase subunit ChlD
MGNEKKFEVAGTVTIAPTGKSVQIEKEDFEKVVDTVSAGAGQSMVELYDQYSKLLYVIDSSGSMGEGLLSEESLKRFKWTPEIIAQFHAAMEQHGYLKKMLKNLREDVADEFDGNMDSEDFEEAMAQAVEEELPKSIAAMTDEEIKWAVVANDLQTEYGIPLQFDYSHRNKGRSKMMAVKAAAKGFVGARFKKWEGAKVGVFKFEDSPRMLVSPGASEQEVLNAIDSLPDGGGGGTNIYRAVDLAVSELTHRGSELKVNHIVLVTDGSDGGAERVSNLVPKMKENGITFDFIYIKGPSGDAVAESVAGVLRGVCEATGGEYMVVTTEEDFQQKFLAASNRPLLPAART